MLLIYYPYPNLNNLLILPNPTLSDSKNLVGKFQHKMSLDGTQYTYLQRNGTEYELQYQFENITRAKFYEIADWIHNYTGYEIRLHDMNDVQYKVILVNPIVSFVMNRRAYPCILGRAESGRFDLVFRGTRNG